MLDRLFRPSDLDIQQFVTKILDSQNDKTNVEAMKVDTDTENAVFAESKDWWGYPKKEHLFGKWNCNLWTVSMKVKARLCSKDCNPEQTMALSDYFESSYGILSPG